MNLSEWTLNYINHRNSFMQNLLSKNKTKQGYECDYKNKGKVDFIIYEDLKLDILKKIDSGKIVLVCLNKNSNIKFLIENWGKFIKNKELKILFVNPKINDKWIIMPYNHHNFSDPDSLAIGIKSISDNVEKVR